MTIAILIQVLTIGRGYAWLSAITIVLLVVWMLACCLLDRVKSKYFNAPTREPGPVWPERRQQLAATVSRQAIP
jgi:hypothetical protein